MSDPETPRENEMSDVEQAARGGAEETTGTTAAGPWEILESAVGRWAGQETMTMGPQAMEARASMEVEPILDGLGISSSYVQTMNGEETLRSHTILYWDAAAELFRMVFVNGAGGPPMLLEGRRADDRLILEGDGPMGVMRQTFEYGRGETLVRSEIADPETPGAWMEVFEGNYGRIPSEPGAMVRGDIGWLDLTVEDADSVRDFYAAVVGWTPQDVSMGDYADYSMLNADGTPVSGVCHARGSNAELPPVWLAYAVVDDIEISVGKAEKLGGEVVSPIRTMGSDRMAVIKDPAGAALALYEKG